MSAIHAGYQGVFDNRLRFGRKAALLLVDFVEAYADPQSPFYAPAVVVASEAVVPLIVAARARMCPVIRTRVEYTLPEAADGGIFVEKVPALKLLGRGMPLAQNMRHLDAHAVDQEIIKQYPSAFFATPLAESLRQRGVDTLLIAGCTTSGCIRATVVDALQHGFRAFVVEDCVGDRSQEAHRVNLLDMQSKYAEVVSLETALDLVMNTAAENVL